MVDWARKPYTREAFVEAWGRHEFVDDVATELDLPTSQGSLRTLKRIAEQEHLKDLPVWGKPYSREEFTQAWTDSLTLREVADRLGCATTRGFAQHAHTLELPPKDTKPAPYTADQFRDAWSTKDSLNDVASALGLPESQKTFTNLKNVARKLGLPAKQVKVHTTSTGEDSSTIISDWVDWHRQVYQVDPTFIPQAAKRVKEFVIAGYSTTSIKYGLFIWTLKRREGYLYQGVMDEAVAKKHAEENPAVAESATMVEQQMEVGALAAPKRVSIEAREW